MTQTQHTPGPCRYEDNSGAFHYGHIVDKNGNAICMMIGHHNTKFGPLFAASPELLAAAANSVRWIAKGIADGAFDNCANPKAAERDLAALEAAIAKARGEG